MYLFEKEITQERRGGVCNSAHDMKHDAGENLNQENIIIEIINKKGLHARAAAKFVKIVASYCSKVTVTKKAANGEAEPAIACGSDILDLLMLGADPSSLLHISAEGTDAKEVILALSELINNKFGEGE